jgi:hypothetical protein
VAEVHGGAAVVEVLRAFGVAQFFNVAGGRDHDGLAGVVSTHASSGCRLIEVRL